MVDIQITVATGNEKYEQNTKMRPLKEINFFCPFVGRSAGANAKNT